MLEAKWITRVEDGVIKKNMKAIGTNLVIKFVYVSHYLISKGWY